MPVSNDLHWRADFTFVAHRKVPVSNAGRVSLWPNATVSWKPQLAGKAAICDAEAERQAVLTPVQQLEAELAKEQNRYAQAFKAAVSIANACVYAYPHQHSHSCTMITTATYDHNYHLLFRLHADVT